MSQYVAQLKGNFCFMPFLNVSESGGHSVRWVVSLIEASMPWLYPTDFEAHFPVPCGGLGESSIKPHADLILDCSAARNKGHGNIAEAL